MGSDLDCPTYFMDGEHEVKIHSPPFPQHSAGPALGNIPTPAQQSPLLRSISLISFASVSYNCGPRLRTEVVILLTTQINNQDTWMSLSLFLSPHTHTFTIHMGTCTQNLKGEWFHPLQMLLLWLFRPPGLLLGRLVHSVAVKCTCKILFKIPSLHHEGFSKIP